MLINDNYINNNQMSINYYQIWRNNSMTTVKEEEEERFVEKN